MTFNTQSVCEPISSRCSLLVEYSVLYFYPVLCVYSLGVYVCFVCMFAVFVCARVCIHVCNSVLFFYN